MNYREIIMNNNIKSVKVIGCDVVVNKDKVYTYKYPQVARAVAKKLRAFIGV